MEDTPAEVIARRMQAHLAPTTGVIAADAAHQGEARSEGFGVSDTRMADAIRRRWLPHDDSPAAPEALPLVQARRSMPPAESSAGAASNAAPAAQHAPSALPHAVAQRRPTAENPAGAASGTVPAAQQPQRALPRAVAQRRPSPAAQVGSSQDLLMRPHAPPEPTAGISAEIPAELQTGTRAGASAGTPAPDNARQAPATTAAMTGSATSGPGVVQASRLPDGALLMRAGSSRGRAATAPAITPALTPAPVPAPTPGQAQGAAGTQSAPYPDMPLQAAPAGGVDVRGGALPGTAASPAPAAGTLPRVHVPSPRIQAGPAQTNLVQAARVQPDTTQPGTTQPDAGQPGMAQSTVRRSPSESVPTVTPAAGASAASVRDPGSAVWGKPIVQRRPGAQTSQTPRIEVQAAADAPLVRRWSAEPASGQIPSGQAQAGQAQAGQAPVAVQADVPVTGYPPAVQLTPVRPPEGQASTGAQTAAPEQPAVDPAPFGQASSAQAPPVPPVPAVQVVASEPTGVGQGEPLPLVRGSAAGAAGNEVGTNSPGPADLVQRQAAAGVAAASAATPAATATSAAGIAPGTVLRTAAAVRPGAAPLSAPNGAATVLRRTPQTNGSTRNPAKEERSTIPVVTAELPAISSVEAPQPPMTWHATSSSADAVQAAAAGSWEQRTSSTTAAGSRLPLQRMPLGGGSSAASSPAPSSSPPAESSSSSAASSSSASMAAPPAGQTAGENAGDAAEVNVERVADAVYAILRDRLIIERESRGLGPI